MNPPSRVIYLSIGAVAALVILPFLIDFYYLQLVIQIFIFVVISSSWNVLASAGQISLGHAAFFGLGAYGAAFFYKYLALGPVLSIFLGSVISLICAYFIGAVCLRIRGVYFAIATLAVAEAVRVVALMTPDLTGGAMGFGVDPLFEENRIWAYYLALAIMVLSLLVFYVVDRSSLQLAFLAIKENEDAADTLGVNVSKYKNSAFLLSTYFVGAMGGFYALNTTYIDPHSVFSAHISILSQIMPIFGGLYTFSGPIIGGVVITLLSEIFRVTTGKMGPLFFGLILIVTIIYFPSGLVGFWKRLFSRKEKKEFSPVS